MIVYQSDKNGFLKDVLDDSISDKINKAFFEHLGWHTSHNEVRSWANSMKQMGLVLADDAIPKNAGISIEFEIPTTSKRVDFIIAGGDPEGKDNAVIVELKQWEEAQLTQKDAMVRTRFQRGLADVAHPSYQAWSYARTLYDYNETVQHDHIILTPCAFLHNYEKDGIIDNQCYQDCIQKAPLFFKHDAEKLREFIERYVKYGDESNILYRIDNGRIKPSKHLADCVASMLSGNSEFILLDDQKDVYETALILASRAAVDKKYVLIVEGGPGTGKSVIAINLLVELIKRGKLAKYVSKNRAPREVYSCKLSGIKKKSEIDSLFGGSGSFVGLKENTFDVLIVDEAHRLNMKSGIFSNLGENQVQEIIKAAKLSIFFIDEEQRVTTKDIGSKDFINKIAKICKAKIEYKKLESQFRCNGSGGYLAWLDNALEISQTANVSLSQEEFDFRIFDDPNELFEKIKEQNEVAGRNKSRVVAGYCWDWSSKKDASKFDIDIPQFNFKKRWNLSDDGSRWIIEDNSINEIGCIHTCQGLELDYVGVIVGPDIRFENGKVITDFKKRAKTDKSLFGIKAKAKQNPDSAYKVADVLIKNTYKVLLTRGMKGCYVYFRDKGLREHFESMMQRSSFKGGSHIALKADKLLKTKIINIEKDVAEDVKFVDYLPLYSMKAACGYFDNGENVETSGWIKVCGFGPLNVGMFIVKASGNSMIPKIADGDYCIFKRKVIGSRSGKILLVQLSNADDPDYDGSYTIKRYDSTKHYDKDTGEWQHETITLSPLNNKDFSKIELSPEADFSVVGEFVGVIK